MASRVAGKIKLQSVDELLGVPEISGTQEIEIGRIHAFPNHPFKVLDDEKMDTLVDSIRENGILNPVIVRPDNSGDYEMISGHRRLHAAGIAGLKKVPAIVKEMSDDEAIINMVDAYMICKELGEVWELLCKTHTEDSINNDDKWLAIHKYVAIASYTSAVLLRDYFSKLEQKEQELCKQIVFSLGKMFTEASRYEVVQAGNGVEAIIVGLITLISEDNRHLISGDNPLYLLLKLILIDWSDDSCIINQISSNIWDYEKQYGWQFLYAFSLIAEQYEKEIKINRDISINDFFGKNNKLIKQALDKEVSNYSDIDFKQLSIPIMFVIILMIPFKIKEASLVAELTKDIAMKITFDDKDSVQEKYGNIYGYIFNYTMWFADVLLHCDNQDRTMLVNSFLERADFVGNDNVDHLLKWLIQEQEIHGKVSEFWSVWEALKPRMIELSHEKDRYYYTDYNGPIGKDRVIASYLFANSEWRENIYRCTLLSEERMDFFDDFIAHTGSFKAVLYSVARLLNTVGKEPYFEKGIE